MIKVSIIIINYNTFQLTCDCIRSVIAFTKEITYEIVLVDNASTECDPGKFIEIFPSIKLIRSSLNGGFAYGNNIGIKNASGEFILLLNSDTLLTEDSISASCCFAEKQLHAGVVGCRMVYPDKSIQFTARRFRSISWELFDLFRFIPHLLPYPKRSALMLGKYFEHNENKECDWVNGAFFLFPKSVLDKLPGKKLDDRFFMYGEDHLWCWQIRKAGYTVLFFADTTIVHINSGSSDRRKQLSFKKLMLKHELEIMKLRKGESLYYYLFAAIYIFKESIRSTVRRVFYRVSGKLIR